MLGSAANNPREASGSAVATQRWSRSFPCRSAKIVPHCDRAWGDNSEGRCEINASETLYLRPSLAIRVIARAVAAKPTRSSAGMYR